MSGRTKKRITFLYRVTCLVDGRLYFGISVDPEERWKSHRHGGGKRDPAKKLHCAIEILGPENFRFEIIAQFADKTQAVREEIRLIRSHGTIWPSGFNLYGGGRGSLLRAGRGRGPLKRPVELAEYFKSDEFSKKVSRGQKAAWSGPGGEERRQKLKERWTDPNFKKRNVSAMLAARAPVSAEARARMSASQKRRWELRRLLLGVRPEGNA